jgi:NADPH:quinone reductase-like Zn-dependent oxidoreductase
VGVDFAGTVVELGANVDGSKWRVGDRVASFIAGGMSPYPSTPDQFSTALISTLLRCLQHWVAPNVVCMVDPIRNISWPLPIC